MSASRLRTVAKLAAEGVSKGAFSYSAHTSPYEKTIQNLKINEHSRVIYQGFTGQVATKNATDTIAYGTKVLGGVTLNPDKETHLDLPLFGSVKDAAKELKPDVSAVFIRGALAADAIIDAIEAEIPLIVSVAEHVPAHHMLRVHEVLRTQSKSRLVGPNGPGIIAPEQCRVGIMPYLQYKRGHIGIVSRSGTLSYEAVGATTELGLGQSLVIGVGGDLTPGTNFTDALKVFFEHEETEGIIMIGEIGGEAELEAADLIAEYRRNTSNPKPIVGMIAGQSAPKGKIMGHAGAVLRSVVDVPASVKMKALEEAGVAVVGHAGALGQEIADLLNGKPLPQVMPKVKPKVDINEAIQSGRRAFD